MCAVISTHVRPRVQCAPKKPWALRLDVPPPADAQVLDGHVVSHAALARLERCAPFVAGAAQIDELHVGRPAVEQDVPGDTGSALGSDVD